MVHGVCLGQGVRQCREEEVVWVALVEVGASFCLHCTERLSCPPTANAEGRGCVWAGICLTECLPKGSLRKSITGNSGCRVAPDSNFLQRTQRQRMYPGRPTQGRWSTSNR